MSWKQLFGSVLAMPRPPSELTSWDSGQHYVPIPPSMHEVPAIDDHPGRHGFAVWGKYLWLPWQQLKLTGTPSKHSSIRHLLNIRPHLTLWPTMLLAALSVAEALTVAQVGRVAGMFYKLMVDHKLEQLPRAFLASGLLYALEAAIASTTDWLAEHLAVLWRHGLTDVLHKMYCSAAVHPPPFFALHQQEVREGEGCSAAILDGAGYNQTCCKSCLPTGATLYSLREDQVGREDVLTESGGCRAELDNADQRMTQDVGQLCTILGQVAKVAAAVPMKLLYYAYWTHHYIGVRPLLLVLLFFVTGAMLQSVCMRRLAHLVFHSERAEGDLRFGHMRVRTFAPEIALWKGAPCEAAALQQLLRTLTTVLYQVVLQRWLLGGVAKGLDYGGILVNYACIAYVLQYTGRWHGLDGGELAQSISNASFMCLTLIYTFSQLLDLSTQLATAAGLLERVGGVMQELQRPAACLRSSSKPAKAVVGREGSPVRGPVRVPSPPPGSPPRRRSGEHWPAQPAADARSAGGRQGSSGARELDTPALARLRVGPMSYHEAGWELSVLQLSSGLAADLSNIFPSAPTTPQVGQPGTAQGGPSRGPIWALQDVCRPTWGPVGEGGPLAVHAVITFQCARGMLDLGLTSTEHVDTEVVAEMDRMLDSFLRWQQRVHSTLTSQGWWCDAVDPRTGTALHDTAGDIWSEVTAANLLLGYPKIDTGICPLISHPLFGRSAYPASLFSNAPLHLLLAAVEDACAPLLPLAATSSTQSAGVLVSPTLPTTVNARASGPMQGPGVTPAACQQFQQSPAQIAQPGTDLAGSVSTAHHGGQSRVAGGVTTASSGAQEQAVAFGSFTVTDVRSARTTTGSDAHVDPRDPRQGYGGGQPASGTAQMARQSDLAVLPAADHAVFMLLGGTCRTPGGALVAQGLNLALQGGGDSLLLWGPSGCGKSSLCLALAGLLPLLQATQLVMPTDDQVCFVPQRPLLGPVLTLRAQLLYPSTPAQLLPQGHAGVAEPSSTWTRSWVQPTTRPPVYAPAAGYNPVEQAYSPVLGQRDSRAQSPILGAAANQGKVNNQWRRGNSGTDSYVRQGNSMQAEHVAAEGHQQDWSAGLGVRADSEVRDEALVAALNAVQLGYLLQRTQGRMDALAPWLGGLSPGELQRLAIARVLLCCPVLAVLDEATSAVSAEMERNLYQQLRRQGISVLSFGQRAELECLHHRVVCLSGDGDGGWQSGRA